jgi:hypothetical protein
MIDKNELLDKMKAFEKKIDARIIKIEQEIKDLKNGEGANATEAGERAASQ